MKRGILKKVAFLTAALLLGLLVVFTACIPASGDALASPTKKAGEPIDKLISPEEVPQQSEFLRISEEKAYEHLYEVMDKYHNSFDVYTDLSAAGNHFVCLGKMASEGDEYAVNINPASTNNPYSGATCIENCFYAKGTNNWGGWYFLNGVLEGEETQPESNWGEYPEAGFDLTEATKLTFWARGKKGGERVEFFALGAGRNPWTGKPTQHSRSEERRVG